MKNIFLSLLFCVVVASALGGVESHPVNQPLCCDATQSSGGVTGNDPYLEGYIQSLLDTNYSDSGARVTVNCGCVYLWNLPAKSTIRKRIVCFVRSIPCVNWVQCCSGPPACALLRPNCELGNSRGVWYPASYLLFDTLVGATRQVVFAGGWRFHDDAFNHSIGATSFGNVFPLYRWYNLGWLGLCGDLQLDLEASVWAIFEWTDDVETVQGDEVALVNADYYVGIPLSYAWNCWATRLRLYHISSHVGDEFLIIEQLQDPAFRRLNPSFEALDLYVTRYFWDNALRLYAGFGWIMASNDSYHFDPFYVEYGLELRLFGWAVPCTRLWAQPYFAANFFQDQTRGWDLDQNYVLGIETSRLTGVGRRVRFFLQYHDGFAQEGQFNKLRTDYWALNLSYGY